jgi:predicted ATPase/DNA-binding CsgD family transcriptional regulator
MKPPRPAGLTAAGVTAREAEVLSAIGGRLTNQEIAGRLVISVRTVESHVSALLRKLGVPGRPALIELARQLAAGPALPAPPTSFVGREEELAALRVLLTAGPLVSLTGPAGCGKSRLALEAARGWDGETRVAALGSAAAADVRAVVAAALGLGYEAADLAAAARVALAGRRLLLVADDCDLVTEAAAEQLTALVRAVPGLRVLATSRQPLGVAEEQLLPVPPLACPAGDDPDAVLRSGAGRLFLDRARTASPRFRLDAAAAAQVAGICRRLDGLPLAIELAAARVTALDLAALADGLTRRLQLLERPAGAGRHRSLTAAIEWSWQLLGPGERDLLGALAALPGEFTLALAAAVVAEAGAASDPEAGLLRLTERSLVSVTLPAGQPARYRLLETIRGYAAAQAPAAAPAVRRAHARYCCELAAAEVAARCHPSPAQPPPPPDELNYLAALTWAAAGDPALADRLLRLLSRLMGMQPSRHGLEVISAAASENSGWSSETLAWVSWALTYLDLAAAEQLAARSAAAAAGERDRACARWAAGWVQAYHRDEHAARALLDPVIAYAQAAADPWLEASAWQARGVARASTADSFADWQQALTRYAAAGDMMHASNVRYMLAYRAVEAGERLAEVPLWLAECESYAASQGYQHELAHIQQVRAVYERKQGRLDTARELLDTALPVFRQAGDFRCVTRTLLLQALETAVLAGGGPLRAQVLAALAVAAAEAGDLPLAAARGLGALGALDPSAGSAAETLAALPADQVLVLQGPACAGYTAEGRAGGISLILAAYPRYPR